MADNPFQSPEAIALPALSGQIKLVAQNVGHSALGTFCGILLAWAAPYSSASWLWIVVWFMMFPLYFGLLIRWGILIRSLVLAILLVVSSQTAAYAALSSWLYGDADLTAVPAAIIFLFIYLVTFVVRWVRHNFPAYRQRRS